jgi:putative transposase
MFRISRFAEVLKSLPRGLFDREVARREADKHRKGFSCWQQLVSMVYLQLSGATSLRVLASSFNAHAGHHYHLGCGPIRRSTLADANAQGDWEVYACVARALMQQVRGKTDAHAQAFLQLLDSTSITLKGRGFDEWTADNRTRHIQGLKLHVLLGLSEGAPLDQWISAPNVTDIEYARTLKIESGTVYVFDRGYCDYSWWWQIACSGAQFVTRHKRNARLQILRTRAIPRVAQGIILKDQLVKLSNKNPGAGRRNPYEGTLRRIEVARAGESPLVLATNDLKSSALGIAERYQARWQIELFFKWIKQHLNIKRLVGRTENAVRIQILTALITYLLVRLHAVAHKVRADQLWQHLAQLRATLFQRCHTELDRHRRWREQRAAFAASQCSLFT